MKKLKIIIITIFAIFFFCTCLYAVKAISYPKTNSYTAIDYEKSGTTISYSFGVSSKDDTIAPYVKVTLSDSEWYCSTYDGKVNVANMRYYYGVSDKNKYKYYLGVLCFQHNKEFKSTDELHILGRVTFNEDDFSLSWWKNGKYNTNTYEYTDDTIPYAAFIAYIMSHGGKSLSIADESGKAGYDSSVGTRRAYLNFAQWVYWMARRYTPYPEEFIASLPWGEEDDINTGESIGLKDDTMTDDELKETYSQYQAALAYQSFRKSYKEPTVSKSPKILNDSNKDYTYSYQTNGDLLIGPFNITFTSASTTSTNLTIVGHTFDTTAYKLAGLTDTLKLYYTDANGKTATLNSGSSTWYACDKNGNSTTITSGTDFYIRIKSSRLSSMASVNKIEATYRYVVATADYCYMDSGNASQLYATIITCELKYKDITLTMEIPETGSIQINKKDEANTSKELSGAGFKIYAVLNDGTEGWLKTNTGSKINEYVSSVSNATVYSAKTEIEFLRFGTYYIYETKAPTTDTNYVLVDQEGYLQTKDSDGNAIPGASTFSKSDEWVYRDSVTIKLENSGDVIEINIYNRPEGSLQIGETGDKDGDIGKVDSITGKALSGAEFKIYAELETTAIDGISSGWVSGGANDGTLKQYVSYSSASTYTSGEAISRLRYGTYYIYETKAPSDEYDLKDQENYKATSDEDGEAKGYEDFADDEEWVYVGQVTINFEVVKQETTTGYTLNVPFETETVENNQKGKLQIEKVDQEYEVLKLEGAEFVIYAELTSDDIENGWVKGEASAVKEYSSEYSNATVYTTDEDGLTEVIEKLNYGTYYIYEIKTPEGYDITKQDNYLTAPSGAVTPDTDDWVYAGTVKINVETLTTLYNNSIANGGEEYVIPATVVTKENLKAVSELEGLVWVDEPDTKGNTENYLYKENDADQKDKELGDIEVRLYLQDDNGNYYVAATTYTEEDGTYTFNFAPNADNYCGTEVTYWQLVTAYVAFVYNNEEYIAVDPFVTATNGMDITINSKAQEVEMEAEELEDENLLDGIPEEDEEEEEQGSKNPGLAVTYQGGTVGSGTVEELNEILNNNETVISGQSTTEILETTPLTGYYGPDASDSNHYKISSINLGLLEKEDPTYSVEETLAYAYITINGFTYIYYYDQPTSQTVYKSYEEVPDVVKQQDAHTYEYADQVSVYSSDIASTDAGESDMQLYLVYSIYVYNSETLSDDDVYNEQKLYLSSLTDTYDTERLKLSADNSGNTQYTGSDQFEMWETDTTVEETQSTATANYLLFDGTSANDNSAYKNGINAGQTIKTYIQFKVKQGSLMELIQGDLSKNYNEATRVDTIGFHEYLRTDNLWRDDLSETEYASDTAKYQRDVTYDSVNEDEDIYYIHRTIEKEETSEALYVAIILTGPPPEEPPSEDEDPQGGRTVSGTVYEDVAEEDTYAYDGTDYTTYVGNGKIDIDDEGNVIEKNRAQGVTVELLKVDTSTSVDLQNLEQATLYVQDEDEESGYKVSPAVTTTDEKGEYSFVGVIPGYYYIRYTYGDGTQRIVDTDGNEVDYLTSVDYKSTILNTEDEDEEEGKGGAGDILQKAMEASWPDYDDANSQKTTESSLEEYYETGDTDEDSMKLLEWYKYLDSTIDFNTAIDNLNMKDSYNGYTYTEKGIYDSDNILIVEYIYDLDGNLEQMVDTVTGNVIYDVTTGYTYSSGNSYPINIQSYTPEMAISVENTKLNHTENKDEHASIYDNFDLGVVKQPQTNTEITKSVVDVELTLQQGSTVLDGVDSTYVTVFDEYQQYLGIELPSDLIYGSEIKATYSIVVENTSQYDYIETDEDDYGTYYKYGTITSSTSAKTIEIGEVIDDVDSKYSLENLLGEEGTATITQTLTSEEISTTCDTPITISKLESNDSTLGENSTTTTNSITFTGWEKISKSETITIEYTVNSLINVNDDTLYTNPARITSLKLSSLTTLTSSYEWGRRSWTEIAIYAATGGDMRNILYIAGAVVLIAIAFGVILIKKKII